MDSSARCQWCVHCRRRRFTGKAEADVLPVPGSTRTTWWSILLATVAVRGLFGGRARGEGAGSTCVASVDVCMHMNGSANNEY